MHKRATGITLDQDVWEKASKTAKQSGRTLSNFINMLLKEHPAVKTNKKDIQNLAKDIHHNGYTAKIIETIIEKHLWR